MKLTIKIEEMSKKQLIYFIPRFILEVRRKIAKNTHLTACIKWSVGYKGKSKKKPTVNLFSPTYTDVSKTLDSELKRLKAKGFRMTVNKAEPISLEEEELL